MCSYLHGGEINISGCVALGNRVPSQPCISRSRLIFELPWVFSLVPANVPGRFGDSGGDMPGDSVVRKPNPRLTAEPSVS